MKPSSIFVRGANNKSWCEVPTSGFFKYVIIIIIYLDRTLNWNFKLYTRIIPIYALYRVKSYLVNYTGTFCRYINFFIYYSR